MRCKTLKAPSAEHLTRLVGYYAGLAEDHQRRDGRARGPVDYYLDPGEPPGRWWGAGCAGVGLVGEVEADQLARMLVARHPLTDRKLGRGYGERSARGHDATFSAPKSVSLLWELSGDSWVRAEVLAAHDTAVTAALSWLAGHGAVARRGTDGVHQVDTRGLTVALFRQHTSRTADPQLHTHALVWAKVQDPTGTWLALDAHLLKGQQRSIGWLYDAALRSELTARLGLAWGELEGGQADLVDVPEGLCQEFSKRSEQVEVRLAEVVRRWVDEHDGVEPDPRTVAILERDAVLKSRPKKPKVTDAEALRADWQRQALDAGYRLPVVPSGRSLPGLAGVDREAVLDEALRRVAKQDSSWLQADLMREVSTLVPADAAPSAEALVALVDSLATEAAGRCTELHRPRHLRRRAGERPSRCLRRHDQRSAPQHCRRHRRDRPRRPGRGAHQHPPTPRQRRHRPRHPNPAVCRARRPAPRAAAAAGRATATTTRAAPPTASRHRAVRERSGTRGLVR